MDNYQEQIIERIENSERGLIFVTSDFSDIADENTVEYILNKMLKEKKIRRVLPGVYQFPERSSVPGLERTDNFGQESIFCNSEFIDISDIKAVEKALRELSKIEEDIRKGRKHREFSYALVEYTIPDPEKVAEAIARNYGWTILPTGDFAFYKLGLLTQVPEKRTYISDGPAREYKFDKVTLKFKHTTNHDFFKFSYKTALLIQVINVYGRHNIVKETIQELAAKFSNEEKATMSLEAENTEPWIYFVLKKIGYTIEEE
ncbi:MAG: DUF6088 family protein [Lachnospiraceae bacterium]